jgi:dTDP-4-dehydrorhamnose 3,5-epimerase
MTFSPLSIAGAFLVSAEPRRDNRGFLCKVYGPGEFSDIGGFGGIVQVNHTLTIRHGTARGMHYQIPPHAERKLIKCVRGRVFDVVLDVRAGSPTFLCWDGRELSAENMDMMLIPEGCAHGFQALCDGCELLYFHTSSYDPAGERGIRVDDPVLEIPWPLPIGELSARDMNHPLVDRATFEGVSL